MCMFASEIHGYSRITIDVKAGVTTTLSKNHRTLVSTHDVFFCYIYDTLFLTIGSL